MTLYSFSYAYSLQKSWQICIALVLFLVSQGALSVRKTEKPLLHLSTLISGLRRMGRKHPFLDGVRIFASVKGDVWLVRERVGDEHHHDVSWLLWLPKPAHTDTGRQLLLVALIPSDHPVSATRAGATPLTVAYATDFLGHCACGLLLVSIADRQVCPGVGTERPHV